MQQGPGLAQDNPEARNWGRPRATQLFMVSASPSQLGQGQVAGHGSPLLQKYCWALQVPRNLPPTAWNRQKSWSERRPHCRWRDAEITFFCVCYSNLRSKTMNWWQKLLPSGIILSWCRMDSSSLYDNRCQWAGIWYLLHRWNIFLQGPVLGSLFTVCMVSIL